MTSDGRARRRTPLLVAALEGNLGSSNYEIPAGVDLEDFESIVVWCRRFSVGFGVAPLGLAM